MECPFKLNLALKAIHDLLEAADIQLNTELSIFRRISRYGFAIPKTYFLTPPTFELPKPKTLRYMDNHTMFPMWMQETRMKKTRTKQKTRMKKKSIIMTISSFHRPFDQ